MEDTSGRGPTLSRIESGTTMIEMEMLSEMLLGQDWTVLCQDYCCVSAGQLSGQ